MDTLLIGNFSQEVQKLHQCCCQIYKTRRSTCDETACSLVL